MAQIVEDYVSFDLAKLLKKKGFDEICQRIYDNDCPNEILGSDGLEFKNSELIEFITAPTLSLACKWLRVRHNLNVEVYRTACGYIGCIVAIPSGTDVKFLKDEGDDKASGQYTEPELAYEAAIKYCLENLILYGNK